jgi:hypothetical protein
MPSPDTSNSAQSNLRLATMPSLPRAEDLAYGLTLARDNPQKTIELPWKTENSPKIYIIKLTCSQSLDEPSWTLHLGQDNEDSILWTYDTHDPELVWSLISAEVQRTAYVSPLTPHEELDDIAGGAHDQKRQSESGQILVNLEAPAESWGPPTSRSGLGDPWGSVSIGQSTGPSPLSRMPEIIRPINDPESYSQSWGAAEPPKTGLIRSSKVKTAEQPANGDSPTPSGEVASRIGELGQLPEGSDAATDPFPFPSLPIPAFHRTPSSKDFGTPQAVPPAGAPPLPQSAPPVPQSAPPVPQSAPAVPQLHAPAASENSQSPQLSSWQEQDSIAPARPQTPPAVNDQPQTAPVPQSLPPVVSPDFPLAQPQTTQPNLGPQPDAPAFPLAPELAENKAVTGFGNDTAYSGFPEPQRADDPFASAVQPPPPASLGSAQNKKKQKASRVNMPAATKGQTSAAPIVPAPELPLFPTPGQDLAPSVLTPAQELPPAPTSTAVLAPAQELPPTPAPPVLAPVQELPPTPAPAVLAPVQELPPTPAPPVRAPVQELPPTPAPAADGGAASEPVPPVPASLETAAPMMTSAPNPMAADTPQEQPKAAGTIQPAAPARPPQSQKPLPPPVPLNRDAVDTVLKSLTYPGTGFLTYNAFMFFVVREFTHFQRAKLPFTVIGFEFYVKTPEGHLYPLPSEFINEAGQRLSVALRPLDWLAHYDQNDFAILLPYTTVSEAAQLVMWLQGAIAGSGPLTGLEGATPLIVCGIAGLPEDCEHPGILLAAAYEAKNRGKEANSPITLYRDLTA